MVGPVQPPMSQAAAIRGALRRVGTTIRRTASCRYHRGIRRVPIIVDGRGYQRPTEMEVPMSGTEWSRSLEDNEVLIYVRPPGTADAAAQPALPWEPTLRKVEISD